MHRKGLAGNEPGQPDHAARLSDRGAEALPEDSDRDPGHRDQGGLDPAAAEPETGEWQDAPTSYYTVKCWRRLAINAVGSLHKGDMVVVRGKFYMNAWVDNQQRPRASLEIEADSLGHDLAYGWSHFLRGSRPQPDSRAGVDAGEAARQDLEPPAADGEAGDNGDGGYLGGREWDESRDAELAMPETDNAGGALAAEDALAASGLAAGASLPEADAVPF